MAVPIGPPIKPPMPWTIPATPAPPWAIPPPSAVPALLKSLQPLIIFARLPGISFLACSWASLSPSRALCPVRIAVRVPPMSVRPIWLNMSPNTPNLPPIPVLDSSLAWAFLRASLAWSLLISSVDVPDVANLAWALSKLAWALRSSKDGVGSFTWFQASRVFLGMP